MIRRSQRRQRRGSSLVEMMVLIGLISMTLTMMSMLTHSILKSSRQIVTRGEVRQVHARLLERLSRDAMCADVSAKAMSETTTSWQYSSKSGRRIEYRASERTIDRDVFGASSQIEQREQFRLPPTFRFVGVGRQDSDAEFEIQIREEGAVHADGRSQQITTGLRLIVGAGLRKDARSETER
jgi:hypothetical protein